MLLNNIKKFSELNKIIFFLCFVSIFLNYINIPFSLFNKDFGLHNPFYYSLFLLLLFLFKEIDLKFFNLYDSKINKIIFIFLISLLILSLILKTKITYDIFLGKIMVLFCITTFFIGPNLSKLITFKSLVILNIFFISLTLVMVWPNNIISNQLCFTLDNYVPRIFCSSIYGYNRGVSLLTSEPSFASLQLTFLIICNLFYLHNICKNSYENLITYFLTIILISFLLLLKSKLGILILAFILLNLLVYFFKKLKINFIGIIVILIFAFLAFISFTDFLVKEFFRHSFMTSCSNTLLSFFFRSLSYLTIFLGENKSLFNYLFNFKGLFLNEELNNQIYLNFTEKNFYLSNFCNGYLIDTFISNKDEFFEPQPLLMKLLFEEGLVVFTLFLMYIFINIKKNFELIIYKNLALFILIYLLFFQSSFLLILNGVLFQIYNYKYE